MYMKGHPLPQPEYRGIMDWMTGMIQYGLMICLLEGLFGSWQVEALKTDEL